MRQDCPRIICFEADEGYIRVCYMLFCFCTYLRFYIIKSFWKCFVFSCFWWVKILDYWKVLKRNSILIRLDFNFVARNLWCLSLWAFLIVTAWAGCDYLPTCGSQVGKGFFKVWKLWKWILTLRCFGALSPQLWKK
jgi:hypothetical protein